MYRNKFDKNNVWDQIHMKNTKCTKIKKYLARVMLMKLTHEDSNHQLNTISVRIIQKCREKCVRIHHI